MNKRDFLKLKVLLPPVEIQRELGRILTTADNEIKVLEDYRNAIEKQKRGLMQKLLTGEIRVIIGDNHGKNYDLALIMKKYPED